MRKLIPIMLLFAILLAAPAAASTSPELTIGGGVVEKVVQPGDTVNLIFTVEASGGKGLANMYYEITADAAVSGYSTGKVSIGGVATDETRSIKVPLIVSSSATIGTKLITVKLWYSGGVQSPVQKSFDVNVGSKILLYINSILYDKEHIEPGKTVTLKAVIENVGDNPAYDLFGSLTATSEYIKPVLSGGEFHVTELLPGQSKEFIFMIDVSSDAETKTYDSTIILKYDDTFGTENTKNFTIGIPISGTPKLKVLNTEMDGTDFKIDVQNLGTAKAKAISVKLVQDEKIMGVKIDNELKPDKQSTLRFKTYKRGTGQLVMNYLDDNNDPYEETFDIEVPSTSGTISKAAIIFFVLAAIESFVIYRVKKGKHVPVLFPVKKQHQH